MQCQITNVQHMADSERLEMDHANLVPSQAKPKGCWGHFFDQIGTFFCYFQVDGIQISSC
jgi:hypothetical protein